MKLLNLEEGGEDAACSASALVAGLRGWKKKKSAIATHVSAALMSIEDFLWETYIF